MADENKRRMKIAYQIVERQDKPSLWLRVGTAYENRDGSLNVKLTSFPVDGKFQLRDWIPPNERPSKPTNDETGTPVGTPSKDPDDDIPF